MFTIVSTNERAPLRGESTPLKASLTPLEARAIDAKIATYASSYRRAVYTYQVGDYTL